MILVTQSYETGDEARDGELAAALASNRSCGVFDKIETLDGSKERISFNEMLEHCGKMYHGRYCVIANSDISFGYTSYCLNLFKRENLLVALTRWESSRSPRFIGHMHGNRFFSGSQDAWGFVAGSIGTPSSEIPLGVIGCDQVIAGWAAQSGIEVVNPSLSIRTTHHHAKPTEGQQAMSGFFGYPQMTTNNTTGDVMCHHWPSLSGEWSFEWQLLATKR
jgi:hypothetical protein